MLGAGLIGRTRTVAALLLAACLVALAVVPDEAVLRPKVVWGRAFLLAAAGVLVVSEALAGRLLGHWPAFLGAALLPGAIALARALAGPVDSMALARDEIERLLLLPLAAWLTAHLLPDHRARHRFVTLLAACAAWVAGYAIVQRLGGLQILGIEPHARADAGFGNPVFLGAWLVLTTPLLVVEALTEPSRTRWLAAVAAGLGLAALLGTGSAGAALGLAAAVVIGVVLLVPATRSLNLLLTIGAIGTVGLLVINPNLLRPRTHGLIWRDTLAMALENPLGVGPGQYQIAFLPYASEGLLEAHPRSSVIINDAHCEALQILAELGWAGLAALALATWLGFKAVRRVLVGTPEWAVDSPRLVGALASVGGCLVMSFVSPDLRFMVTIVVLGMLIGLASSFADPVSVRLRGGKPARAALALLALAGTGWVARDTWQRLALEDLVRPGTPFRPTAEHATWLAALRGRVEALPEDPQAHYDLGVALSTMGRHAEAAASLERCLELAPGNASATRSLGIVSALAGRFDRAVELLETTLEARPGDLDVRYALAFASYGRGDVRTAIVEVEDVLRRAPDHVRARLLLEKLRE